MQVCTKPEGISRCLLDLILFGASTCWITCFMVFRSFQLRNLPRQASFSFKISRIKISLSMTCMMLYIVKLTLAFGSNNLTGYALLSFGWAMASIMCCAESYKRRSSHWSLRFWWTTSFLLSILDLAQTMATQWILSLFIVIPSTCISFIGLYLHQDDEYSMIASEDLNQTSDPDRFAYSKKPFWQRIFFSWMTPMFQIGYRRQIQPDDLVKPSVTAKDAYSTFEKLWNLELQKPKPNLNWTLAKSFKKYLVKAGMIKLVNEIDGLIFPLLIRYLLLFLEDPKLPTEQGLVLVILVSANSVLYTLSYHWFLWLSHHAATNIRACLITAVYNKSFKLNSTSRAEKTTGDIINIQAIDCQKYADATINFHEAWSFTLRIIVVISILIYLLGPSALAGVAVLVVIVPAYSKLGIRRVKLEEHILKLKDERINEMTEMLSGIRVLKFFAWENYFSERIRKIRNLEYQGIRTLFLVYDSISHLMWIVAPGLINLSTYTAYILSGHVLTPAIAFTTVAFFNELTEPFMEMGEIFNFFFDLSVSTRRISEFLQLEELDLEAVDRGFSENRNVEISGGDFSWAGESMTLKGINFQVEEGTLTAIVGTVGSGKSSLLEALLGNIPKVKGYVRVSGSCAYVAQQAWIRNQTVKDNILFGKAYDSQKYHAVLDACQLREDLKILPAGDQTEIGERGINLSGGQRQRIALARAVYQDCDVYLIDDCLSAVDAHVGHEIFDKVLVGLLKSKTRILVTHQLQYLNRVDTIAVLKDGTILEQGTFEKLMSEKGEFFKLISDHVTHSQVEKQEETKVETEVEDEEDDDGIINAEDREEGRVSFSVWKEFFQLNGIKNISLRSFTLLLFLATPVLRNLREISAIFKLEKRLELQFLFCFKSLTIL
eukprot:TRINITY_DN4887_c3_g1_i1.p1 TRINITY_DN4887_c3_g1~~TRINITY_DN4887_c3_g1_i1.p1  ORF type:complete len:888 (+),score=209.87 TRINITY_DN4887_c3_g1_i1:55-2718(+)